MPSVPASAGRSPIRGPVVLSLMNAKTFIVQHEWDSSRTGEVVPVVSKVIENAQSGKLPAGFNLLGVLLSKEAPKAYCVWKSESKASLEGLLSSVNPPTRHSVSEFDWAYGIPR